MSILSFSGLKAQQWIGRTSGNYAGTYGIYTNAASISDSKYKYYFNFWGRGVNFYNNYLLYNSPIKLNQWANNTYSINYQTLDGKVDYQKDWLRESLDGKTKQFSFNQDIWGPAFMFPISKNWNMSINTRQRSGLQIFGLNEDLARLAFNGMDSGKYASNNGGFGVNIQSYQELSFTLGGILAKNERNQLNGGATVKFIRGLGAAYLKGNDINIAGTGSNSANVNGDFQYAYTDDKSVISPFNDPYGLFALQSKGAGAGFDLGLSYMHTSKRLKYANKNCNSNDKRSDYDFKLALALNDVGGIKYGKGSTQYAYSSGINTNVTAPSTILDPFHNARQNAFDTIGQEVFGKMGATKSYGFNTSLPTALNVQMDFRLTKNFYLGAYLNQNLKKANSTGLRSTSMLSLVPRIESRGFELSMPLTLSENYKNFYVGFYTRIGPVFFGSDNLGGLLNVAANSQFSGADIYGGISFGIGHCHRWWYENKVDPVYTDSTRIDSVRTHTSDTIKISKKDSVLVRDTVKMVVRDTIIIDKTAKNKELAQKELELKNKELELNRRKALIDAKEREIINREKGLTTDNEVLIKCNEKNNVLDKENTVLRAKVIVLTDEKTADKKRIEDLEREVANLKKPRETNSNAEVLRKQKQIDSLTILLGSARAEYEKCKQNTVQANAEVLKKAELDKQKAENNARYANRRADSLQVVLTQKAVDLEFCKKSSTMTNNEIVKKLETDKNKAENDARIARRQADSLSTELSKRNKEFEDCKKNQMTTNAQVLRNKKVADSLATVLSQRNNELDNCKKLSVGSNTDVVKQLEKEKAKMESDARFYKKQADSLNNIVAQKNTELDNCKKANNGNSSEVIKQLEKDKAKMESDARYYKKQADSLNNIVDQKNTELENCKKNSTQSDADAELKKCEDNNVLLKSEISEMSKTIGKLNTKNSALTYKVDSLTNELKNCCKNCGTGNNNDALLEECKASNTKLNAEILTLKNRINAQNKSLDSMENVASDMKKKTTDLNVQILKLSKDLEDLKSSNDNSNCDDIKKQLDSKTAEYNKLKEENDILQNKVTTLTNQLNQYKNEYNFMVKQNQKCSSQLDSCKRGLYNTEPKGDGGTGMIEEHENDESNNEGIDESDSQSSSEVIPVEPEEKNIGAGLGFKILGAILEAAVNSGSNSNSSGNSGSSGTSRKSTSTNTNNNTGSSTGTGSTGTSTNGSNRPTEGSSGSNGSGSSSGSSNSGRTSTNTNTNTNTGGSTGSGTVNTGNSDRGAGGSSSDARRR
ncbi:MAG TPA: DUF5723 family protein [Bacteroidia bacterium]